MSRAERLLELIALLRRHRIPVTGPDLARELNVSLRTLYRDIATLQGQGADIRGERGLGYVLLPGFVLPPMMFTADEIEALVLGTRWVSTNAADGQLNAAAASALSKIAAIVPEAALQATAAETLLVPGKPKPGHDLAPLRLAIRQQHKLAIAYRDPAGALTARTIWPFAIGYFEAVYCLAAWCELRTDFRTFRIDRITDIQPRGERYPRPRTGLIREWRERERQRPQHPQLPETVTEAP